MTSGFDGSKANVTPSPAMLAAPHHVPSRLTLQVERTIASRVLGDTIIPAESLYAFPEGLHGFEAHTEFALVACERAGFWWLQATDEPALAFLLVDPFAVHAGYEVDLGAGDAQFLGLLSPSDALVLTVVTLPSTNTGQATTNLRGPIVLNLSAQRARQIVRADDRYSLQAAVAMTQ